ncbi:hypothetical protein V5799_008875 [Amblyomma americanum]|uniref:Uncharacterized protein n=1 Tax=Amblyomma americanum TaxID=6943 RepID=A0AAQ4FDI1_AMBAM
MSTVTMDEKCMNEKNRAICFLQQRPINVFSRAFEKQNTYFETELKLGKVYSSRRALFKRQDEYSEVLDNDMFHLILRLPVEGPCLSLIFPGVDEPRPKEVLN